VRRLAEGPAKLAAEVGGREARGAPDRGHVQRLSVPGVVVDLRVVAGDLVEGLIVDAWRRKAPRRLVDEFEASSATG
jgi:hypothetical protein